VVVEAVEFQVVEVQKKRELDVALVEDDRIYEDVESDRIIPNVNQKPFSKKYN